MEGWVEECRDEETEMGGWMEYPYFWMDAMIFLSFFLVFFFPLPSQAAIDFCYLGTMMIYNTEMNQLEDSRNLNLRALTNDCLH